MDQNHWKKGNQLGSVASQFIFAKSAFQGGGAPEQNMQNHWEGVVNEGAQKSADFCAPSFARNASRARPRRETCENREILSTSNVSAGSPRGALGAAGKLQNQSFPKSLTFVD